MALLEPSMSVRWFGACRTPTQRRSSTKPPSPQKASGGIGFMVLNKMLSVHCIAHDNKGMLALSVQLPGFKPICVIGLYIPPATSVFNAPGAEYTTHLTTLVSTLKRDICAKFDVVVVMGDLNMRMGNVPGLHIIFGILCAIVCLSTSSLTVVVQDATSATGSHMPYPAT